MFLLLLLAAKWESLWLEISFVKWIFMSKVLCGL